MPETSPILFTTSVVLALGGLVAGAVAGYALLRGSGSTGRLLSALGGSILAVYDQTTSQWYFFKFGALPTTCQVFVAQAGTQFPTIGPPPPIAGPIGPTQTNAVDTNSWFSSLQGQNPSQVSLLKSASGQVLSYITGTMTISTDPAGNLASLASVLIALPDMSQIPASWNEIGKNHN